MCVDLQSRVRALIARDGLRAASERLGIAAGTVRRLESGSHTYKSTRALAELKLDEIEAEDAAKAPASASLAPPAEAGF